MLDPTTLTPAIEGIVPQAMPEVIGPFRRNTALSRNGCTVYVAATIGEHLCADGHTRFKVSCGDPIVAKLLTEYATKAPRVHSKKEMDSMESEDLARYTAELLDYEHARNLLAEIVGQYIKYGLLPQTETYRTTAADEQVVDWDINPETAVSAVKIHRAGGRPTEEAAAIIGEALSRPVEFIDVMSERKKTGSGSNDFVVEQHIKGTTTMSEHDVMLIIDPALASTTSLVTAVNDVLADHCEGLPGRLILVSFRSTEEGILKLTEAFPGAIIMTLLLGGWIDKHGYLRAIAIGDVGARDSRILDRIVGFISNRQAGLSWGMKN